MNEESESKTKSKKVTFWLMLSNVVVWAIAILASATSNSHMLPITVVGGGTGSIALFSYLKK